MFNVTIYDISLPISFTDYSSVTDATSTETEIVFNPAIATVDWIGRYILITDGNMAGYIAQIGAYTEDGPNTTSVTLNQELPAVPTTGSDFRVIHLHGTGNMAIDMTGSVKDLSIYVDDVTFQTDIKVGYSRGIVKLKKNAIELSNSYSTFLGQYVIFSDMQGRDVYHGIIAGISLDGEGGTIECVGIGQTLGWYNFYGLYNTDPTVTAPAIIRDIMEFCPYVDQEYMVIDNDDSWDALQQAVGGIGPRDFTQSNTTCRAALDKILEMGNYGYTDETVSAYIQIWDYGQAYLKFGKHMPEIDDADWILSNRNVDFGKSGIEIVGDIADSYAYASGSYNSEEGLTIETAGYANMDLLNKFGLKKKEIVTGEGKLITQNTMRTVSEDQNYIAGPGRLQIKGNVRSARTESYNNPLYMVRAGDIILIEDPISGSPAFQNSISSPAIVQVGTTNYSSDKLTIGLTKLTDVSSIFQKQIDVEGV